MLQSNTKPSTPAQVSWNMYLPLKQPTRATRVFTHMHMHTQAHSARPSGRIQCTHMCTGMCACQHIHNIHQYTHIHRFTHAHTLTSTYTHTHSTQSKRLGPRMSNEKPRVTFREAERASFPLGGCRESALPRDLIYKTLRCLTAGSG